VLITVSGRAVDVRAAVVADDSHAEIFADAPNRRMGVETLLIDAPHQRFIVLKIERNDHSQARGRADVMAVALPLTTESDRRRLQAARLDATGCQAYPDVSQGQKSVEAFTAAARLHEKNGNRLREGLARLHAAGARYTRLADWAGAAELASEAAAMLARSDAPELVAIALRIEGAALDQRANATGVEPKAREQGLKWARERLTEAFERFQKLGNSYEAGYALNYRGVSFHVAGESELARDDYRKALDLFRSAGDGPAQALSLQSLALQSHEDGRLGDAMREFDEALALIPRDEDPENYAHTLHNSAWPLRVVGRFDEAVARFYEAAKILHERGDRDGEARALHGLGTTLMYAGEPQRASELLEAAIRLRGETGAKREQAVSLFVLGQLEREAGQAELAIAHHAEALSLVTAPHDLAQARLSLARDYLAAEQFARARRELNEILRLDLPATHRYLGLALAEFGGLESLTGQSKASREYFARAIKILDANGSDLEHARTLVRRAEALLRIGDTQGAVADTGVAIKQLEDIGLQSLQAESRAAFRASYRDAVELQIAALLKESDLLQRSGNESGAQQLLRSALTTSDNARAHLLGDATPLHAVAVPDELLSRRKQIYERLAGKRQQRDRLLNASKPDEKQISGLTRDIAVLRTEASLVDGHIAKINGAADVRTPNRADDLVALLPENVVVAEYLIGRTQSWLFEARKGQVKVHAIATGSEIEKLARRLYLAWRTSAKAQKDRLDAGRTLAQVLFGLLGALRADESLYLIPDGPLHLVPMTVLAQQALPSMRLGSVRIFTAVAVILDRGEIEGSGVDRMLAVIADPIYSADDSRIRGTAKSTPGPSEVMLTRGARGLAQLRRLPSTAVEAKAIVSLVSDSGATLTLLGADASRGSIAGASLDRYRIVHFATHAFADSQDPALAMLALSRFDGNGRPMDGALRSFDIAQLHLNADLVVLSACDTALGREIAGEGPLGLAHAFLRDGAKSVVATLWQVPDTSTALLMQEFYRQMLIEGRPAAAALELARQHIREQPRWSDPYFWAGFQLISNARFEAGNNNVERRGE
jgi:CHAT domain-containing protein/tetratricopeptide (TPR) repeat protein